MDDRNENWKLEMKEDEIREIERNQKKNQLVSSLNIPQAIIIASVIIILGGWTGKIIYDEIEARRIAAALNQLNNELSRAIQVSNKQRASLQEQAERRQAENKRMLEQRERQRREAEAQARQEQRLQSDNCQFWLRMDEQQSTERTRAKRAESCG